MMLGIRLLFFRRIMLITTANIVNDKLGIRPHERKRNKTTLIVTTTATVTQCNVDN